jgi:transposase
MQLFGLHKNVYRLADYACTQELLEKQQEELDKESRARQEIFGKWELMKSWGKSDAEVAKVAGISRSTYYRRKKLVATLGIKGFINKSKRPKRIRDSKIPKEVIELVLQIRQANPTYGKAKIAVILKRDYQVPYSESSIGRIISQLIKDRKIKPSISFARPKRRRQFNHHAQRWRYEMKATSPGEMVQIDHMSVTKNNIGIKHF